MGKRMKHNCLAGGFTIIEMIIVIVIVVIVAGIAFPVYINAKEKGRQSQCLSNLRQLGQACLMYAKENDDVLPPYCNSLAFPGWDLSGDRSGGIPSPEKLCASLKLYINNDSIFFCPSDPYAGKELPLWGKRLTSYNYTFKRDGSLTVNGYKSPSGTMISPSTYSIIYDARIWIAPTKSSERTVYTIKHLGSRNCVYLDGHTDTFPVR